jgi:hypothetical protein
MPIHDWTRVRANRFHHFHQMWSVTICNALNDGRMPTGYFALAEQITGGTAGVALADAPLPVRHTATTDAVTYARKANAIVIRHPDGVVVAIVELVSPGNKDSKHALRSFTRKAVQFLHAGIHLLIVDLFPPSKRDPHGIHKLIWDHLKDEPYTLPAQQPLTFAAYSAAGAITAYVNNVGVGESLPDMPIFLLPERYVPCPLEATYQAAWAMFPPVLRGPLLEQTTEN